jgi:hypothetical protein
MLILHYGVLWYGWLFLTYPAAGQRKWRILGSVHWLVTEQFFQAKCIVHGDRSQTPSSRRSLLPRPRAGHIGLPTISSGSRSEPVLSPCAGLRYPGPILCSVWGAQLFFKLNSKFQISVQIGTCIVYALRTFCTISTQCSERAYKFLFNEISTQSTQSTLLVIQYPPLNLVSCPHLLLIFDILTCSLSCAVTFYFDSISFRQISFITPRRGTN